MSFDLIIKNGHIIDGAGNPSYRGDIGICSGRIAAIGSLKGETAGTFSRMIGFPGDLDPDKVDAMLENGILTVEILKAEDAKPKQITVKA